MNFEHAEDSTNSSPFHCDICKTPINEIYFQINSLTACESCKNGYFAEKPGFSGYLRATIYGIVGAILGGLADLLITVLTGYQLGIIAIVMGWLVGAAVNLGSRGRGGALFQILAMGLTYLAICGSLGGQIVRSLAEGGFDNPIPSATASPILESEPMPSASDTPIVIASPAPQGAEEEQHSAEAEAQLTAFENTEEPIEPQSYLLALAMALGLCLALPIIVGMEAPFSLLIYGFAIYQAWSMTKRKIIEGPFLVGTSMAPNTPEPDSSYQTGE